MPKKILVVDDDVATLKFVRANLEANNYQALAARDGDEALKVMEREFPDTKGVGSWLSDSDYSTIRGDVRL